MSFVPICPLSTSNNGIDGSVLVDFLNVKVALSIFHKSRSFSVVLTWLAPTATIANELG
jgi:hypothetical protein